MATNDIQNADPFGENLGGEGGESSRMVSVAEPLSEDAMFVAEYEENERELKGGLRQWGDTRKGRTSSFILIESQVPQRPRRSNNILSNMKSIPIHRHIAPAS